MTKPHCQRWTVNRTRSVVSKLTGIEQLAANRDCLRPRAIWQRFLQAQQSTCKHQYTSVTDHTALSCYWHVQGRWLQGSTHRAQHLG